MLEWLYDGQRCVRRTFIFTLRSPLSSDLSTSLEITSLADYVAKEIVDHVNELGVDGIDLVQNQGYGTDNMNADDLSSIHLYLLSKLRQLMPTKLLSYTFPAQGYDFYIDFPFRDVIQYGHQYLNTINV